MLCNPLQKAQARGLAEPWRMVMSVELRLGLVGGGPGSFIGPVHRMAAELDGRMRLVAGAFSSDPALSIEAGRRYGLADTRSYPSWQAMIAAEAARDDGIQLVAIVTPNSLHFPVAQAALAAGLHVMSDKPATATLSEAVALRKAVAEASGLYALTYTYTGYPMVRAARALCAAGRLGAIRKILVEYIQGWLARPLERQGDKQAAWRADPARAGLGGCIGDIGVHAFNLAEFVSGQKVTSLSADLASLVPGRALDDDCSVLLRFDGGGRGALHASQIAAGSRNGLRLRIWGEKGGLDWSHEQPDRLTLDWPDEPSQVLHAASSYLPRMAAFASRLPAGHPEGYIEAFATIYRDFADAIADGCIAPSSPLPTIAQGVRGMAFIDAAVTGNGAGWIALTE
jgi:predicted dehydrogenase